MPFPASLKSPLPDGGADDQVSDPDTGGEAAEEETDPIFAALDAIRDQIDAVEARLMAQKAKPGDLGAGEAPPAPAGGGAP